MHRTATRTAVVFATVVLLCLSLWPGSSLAETARGVQAERESWYQTSPAELGSEDPTCALPIGCAPKPSAPIQPYPEDTLQIGVAAGRDTARSFVMLDLGKIPDDALITGGTLTLPVLTDPESGSSDPQTADLSACAVIGTVKKARGGAADDEPEFSCESAGTAKYVKGKQPAFTIDLKPLSTALSSGAVAIVPSKKAREDGATWRVAVPAKEHASKETITATLTYDQADALGGFPFPPGPVAESGGGGSVEDASAFDQPAGSGAAGSFDDPAPPAQQPQDAGAPAVAAPAEGAAPQKAKQPVVVGAAEAAPLTPVALTDVYFYPGVWLAPLALAGIAGLLARSLTGEIVLPAHGGAGGSADDPDLLARLVAAFRGPTSSGTTNT